MSLQRGFAASIDSSRAIASGPPCCVASFLQPRQIAEALARIARCRAAVAPATHIPQRRQLLRLLGIDRVRRHERAADLRDRAARDSHTRAARDR